MGTVTGTGGGQGTELFAPHEECNHNVQETTYPGAVHLRQSPGQHRQQTRMQNDNDNSCCEPPALRSANTTPPRYFQRSRLEDAEGYVEHEVAAASRRNLVSNPDPKHANTLRLRMQQITQARSVSNR